MNYFKPGDIVRRKQERITKTWLELVDTKEKFTVSKTLSHYLFLKEVPFLWVYSDFELVTKEIPSPIDFGELTPDQYVELAMRTASNKYLNEFQCHTMALMIESAEYADLMHKAFNHEKAESKVEQIKSELGDIMWNIACACHFHRIKLSDVLSENLNKLKRRHGDRYNAKHYSEPK